MLSLSAHQDTHQTIQDSYEQLIIGCNIENWDWEWDGYINNWSGCYVTYHADEDESHGKWEEKARENTQRDAARNRKCLQTGVTQSQGYHYM